MSREQSRDFEKWGQALDALSAVVKLFANGTLRLPADKILLERLEQAENAARQPRQSIPDDSIASAMTDPRGTPPNRAVRGVPKRRGGATNLGVSASEGLRSVPSLALPSQLDSALVIKLLDAIKPIIEDANKTLSEDKAKQLKDVFEEIRSLTDRELLAASLVKYPPNLPTWTSLPSARKSSMVDTLKALGIAAVGTAGGNELPSAIHLLKQLVETKAHL